MAEARYYWLRLQENFFKSLRIKKLRKLAGGDTFTIIYLKMQLMAIKSDGILTYKGVEPTFAEELALDMDESADNVEITVRYLLSCGLMETADDKEFFLPYAVENTGKEGSSAKRVREYRERKALQCNANVTDAALHCHGEKEKEIEIEKEIKKEEDIEPPAETLPPPCPDEYPRHLICKKCGRLIASITIKRRLFTAEEIAKNSKSKYGEEFCWECKKDYDFVETLIRHKYGEYKNVLLTDEDLEKLKAEFPDWKDRIERLSSYIAQSGKSYKNHLATIRNWARKDKESGKRGTDHGSAENIASSVGTWL